METRERADAARNRARVLSAAARLLAEDDPRMVTMEDIARAAGVGRGTLYRRYPDVSSIAAALLDEHERLLQGELLRGAPPLGPGAPPHERLAAFLSAMVDLLDRHSHLALGAEVGAKRYTVGAYGFWRAHVLALLRQAGAPDPEALADVVLAPLAPELFLHQRAQGVTTDRIKAALTRLAHATTA
ncbi:TetR/AcrR family transcriptional regulator [Streptomyces marincola]|uniref:TetR/AcrR family transcriptional regulator n=1 Tax=Streptomyces marincola TaxID=2878388 RepID=UPI001CF5F6F5|nr:helix-turn-helix domain-containing protein [Streptomyces marincola]UCM91458.1 TetR/AcrR family transcriptional regulator [Streptomyces marincola]